MIDVLSVVDVIIAPLLLIVFYIVCRGIKFRHIEQDASYRFFMPAMFIKVFGGIAVCLVYVYYYHGAGDTVNYYHDNVCVSRLFIKDPMAALRYTFGKMDIQLWMSFDDETDWPYFGFDKYSIYVSKITWVLSLITFNSFVGQTMLLAFITFFAMWRLYIMFVTEFPPLQKELAIAILFIPSVIFWGSGLLKDTLTLAGVSIFTSSFYRIVKQKKSYAFNTIYMICSSWVLLCIKPYIFFALMPGTLIWFAGFQLEKLRNKVIRTAISPLLIVIAIVAAYVFLWNMGNSLGDYALDNVLDKAVAVQHDLKQDYYHGSSFDIGELNPTVFGILSKAPIAMTAALFRPFLWESYNPAMIVSGIENLGVLLFTIYLLIRLRIFNFFSLVMKNNLLFFCVAFSFFFAFSVGLTTSNFGSLVRYKIPALPFFVASLIITNYYYQEKKMAAKLVLEGNISTI